MTRCGRCREAIRPNNGQYPNRGPWLDGVDWSVCDWTYAPHAPAPQDEEGQRRRRFQECAEQFGSEGEYDPRCCRFPKSCSPYPYPEAIVADDDLEPLR